MTVLIVGWLLTAAGVVAPAWTTLYVSLHDAEATTGGVPASAAPLQLNPIAIPTSKVPGAESDSASLPSHDQALLPGPADIGPPLLTQIVFDREGKSFALVDGTLYELKDPYTRPPTDNIDHDSDIPNDPLLDIFHDNDLAMTTQAPSSAESGNAAWPFIVGGVVTVLGVVALGLGTTRFSRRSGT